MPCSQWERSHPKMAALVGVGAEFHNDIAEAMALSGSCEFPVLWSCLQR